DLTGAARGGDPVHQSLADLLPQAFAARSRERLQLQFAAAEGAGHPDDAVAALLDVQAHLHATHGRHPQRSQVNATLQVFALGDVVGTVERSLPVPIDARLALRDGRFGLLNRLDGLLLLAAEDCHGASV